MIVWAHYANCASLLSTAKMQCTLWHIIYDSAHISYGVCGAVSFSHLLCIWICALCKSYDRQLIRLCGMTFFDLNNHVAWAWFRNIIIYLIEMMHTDTRAFAWPLLFQVVDAHETNLFTHFFICLAHAFSTWFSLSFPLRFDVSFADYQLKYVYLRFSLWHKNKTIWNSSQTNDRKKNNIYRKSQLS